MPRDPDRLTKLARLRRAMLVEVLGARCEACGDDGEWAPLEVHHKRGRSYLARRLSSLARVNRYWEEYRRGVPLGILCKPCNGSVGAPPKS